MTLNLAARRMLAKRAEICVLPNLRRAEIFDEIFDKDLAKSVSNGHRSSAVVWNCPSIEEVSKPRSAHDGGDLWVLYHGSIVPPRLPISVIEALALLPERVKLCVVGYETIGHPGYVDKLQKTADRLGLGRRVEFAGTLIDRQELLARCRKCDVGLALMPTTSEDINMQFMVGASNKPFDYLSCGLALLVSDLPDWKMAFVEAGYGLACDPDDSESIADALRFYLDHPDEMRSMGELGRLKIAGEWNYEIQFTPVLKKMCAASK